MSVEALFLPMRQGNRFCLLHEPPPGAPHRGAVLFIHPFAEEMNRSRRMAAQQSRAFGEAGWTTLQVDLYGCGDSDGDFSEAQWEQWVADVADAWDWLQAHSGHRPMLWGIRAGCLLAAQAASRMARADLVLWQPVLSGKHYLRQFLRMKGASELMARNGGPVTSVQALREKLDRGETTEIAGYPLAPGLASAMDAAELDPPRGGSRIAWFEIRGSGGSELSPASRARVEAWLESGHVVDSRVVRGPAFWHVFDAEDCPALIESTLDAARAWQP